jgi:CheY-like chemotaxis protein
MVRCDANQLESALLNLAINARDAMPGGGHLTIVTSHLCIDASSARAAQSPADVKPGEYVCIAVTDSGEGMAPAVAAQAFEPFFTTKPLGQGTGLGLSMVYGFAGQSGGFADIDSRPGLGATVRVLLPACADARCDDASMTPHAAARASRSTGAGQSVLVVEDDAAVRQLLVELLGGAGYQVLTADAGFDGLARLESDSAIDLLVTDIGLPGINGRQLAEAGRLLRPGLPVLFMTGYAELTVASGGFMEEGMQMIVKPFQVGDLLERVAAMLAP